MRVSEYYELSRSQASLPFIDVDVENDVKLFINAQAIRTLDSDWGEYCTHLLTSFFDAVIGSIRSGSDNEALQILSRLSEPNETHLGLSKGKSEGRGLGPKKAREIWQSLRGSKAVKTGLLSDLEDTTLLIEGVSVDILSDIITNIIREPLINFTQLMCEEYGIPLASEVASGPLWNPENHCWDERFVSLPDPNSERLILVPKSIVRSNSGFNVGVYYRHYVLEELKNEELKSNSDLVKIVQSGKNKGDRKVLIKDLKEKYGTQEKAVSVKYTEANPAIYQKFKSENSQPTPALSHRQIADVQGLPPPNWDALLKNITDIQPGKKGAYHYEDAITDLLSALFYPVLVDPEKQTPLHNGLKRVDLTFTNYARSGFFEWLARHYPCSHIFVECKNFGGELGNPEIDQIAMRFSKERGQVGIVVCRNIENRQRLDERCKAAARDGHGYVIVLSDAELEALVVEMKAEIIPTRELSLLKTEFDKLIF